MADKAGGGGEQRNLRLGWEGSEKSSPGRRQVVRILKVREGPAKGRCGRREVPPDRESSLGKRRQETEQRALWDPSLRVARRGRARESAADQE